MPDRRKTHGDYVAGCAFTQGVKSLLRATPNWDAMTPTAKETIEMIIHKVHRVTSGDPDHEDHWVDIRDYADLQLKIIQGKYPPPEGEVIYGREEGTD